MDVGDRAESNPTWWDLGPQHRHRPGKPMTGLQLPTSQAEATWLADAGILSQTGSEHVSAQAPLRSSEPTCDGGLGGRSRNNAGRPSLGAYHPPAFQTAPCFILPTNQADRPPLHAGFQAGEMRLTELR